MLGSFEVSESSSIANHVTSQTAIAATNESLMRAYSALQEATQTLKTSSSLIEINCPILLDTFSFAHEMIR
jgi:hypothetical protein